MNAEERKVILLTSLAHGLTHAYMLIFPAVLTMLLKEFSVGVFQISLAGNLSYFAYGFGGLPAGVLADRIGSRKLIFTGLLGMAASSLLVGLSGNFHAFAVFMALLGIFAGLYHPAGLSLVSRAVRAQGRALGYHGMAGNLGLALSPFIAGAVTDALSWRWSYALFSLPGIVLGTAILLITPKKGHSSSLGADLPDQRPSGDLGRLRESSLPDKLSQSPPDALAHASRRARYFDKVPACESASPQNRKGRPCDSLSPLILVYTISVLSGFTYRGSLTFLPTYLAERVKWSPLGIEGATLGSLITTIALLIGILAQYVGGNLAERLRLEHLWAALMASATPFLLLIGATANVALTLMVIAFIFFYFCAQPVGNSLIAKFTPAGTRGLGYGVSFFFAFGMGSFASGVSGYIAENYGLSAVFYVLGGITLVAAAVALMLTRVGVEGR